MTTKDEERLCPCGHRELHRGVGARPAHSDHEHAFSEAQR
jgi:hypothetical protein